MLKKSNPLITLLFCTAPLISNNIYATSVKLQPVARESINIQGQKNNGSDNAADPFDDFNNDFMADQLQEFKKLKESMDKVFDDTFIKFNSKDQMKEMFGTKRLANNPDIKLVDDKDKFIATLSLPKANKNSVNVKIEDQTLVVSGNLKEQVETISDNRKQIKQYSSSFMKSVRLPEDVASESLKTDFSDNALKITVYKKAK